MIKDYLEEFEEDCWFDFHKGEFDDQDGYYTYFKEWINRKCIYTDECKEIVDDLSYDIFASHPVWGRPDSWADAAMNALDDYLTENSTCWREIEEWIDEENC